MPEPDKKDYPPTQKPNGVEIWSAVVLTLTLIVVSIYTCEAHRQNVLTQQAIELNTRPYVGVVINGMSDVPPFTPAGGQKLSLAVAYINFGKLPAGVHIQRTLMLSTDRLESGPDLVGASDKREMVSPPPAMNIDNVKSPQPLTAGQVADLHDGHGGWLYFRAHMTYGSRHTDVCWEWEVIPGTGGSAPTLGEYRLCQNPAVNTGD
jgi:hypothetical protein